MGKRGICVETGLGRGLILPLKFSAAPTALPRHAPRRAGTGGAGTFSGRPSRPRIHGDFAVGDFAVSFLSQLVAGKSVPRELLFAIGAGSEARNAGMAAKGSTRKKMELTASTENRT